MSDRFDQYYMLQNHAKKMEQAGNYSKAIELFTEIVESYQPYDDYAFDRLSVLLEKNSKFAESYAVCQTAMDKIKEDGLKGDFHKFEERQHRLEEKLKGHINPTKEKGAKEEFHPHIPFFKHVKGKKALISLALYVGALLVSAPFHWLRFITILLFYGFLDYIIDGLIKLSQNKRAWITMAVAFLFLGATVMTSFQLPEVKQWIQLKEDQKNAESETLVKDSAGDIIEDPDQPLIDQPLLDKAKKTIELEPIFNACTMTASANIIEINLIVEAGTATDEAKRVLMKVSKNISTLASAKGTTPPSGDFYGSLYETYRIDFTVIDTFETIIVQGRLFKNRFTWQ